MPIYSNKKIKVGIIEDDYLLRESIKRFLETTGNFYVVFSLPKLSEFFEHNYDTQTEIILLDIHLRDGVSIENIFLMYKKIPFAKIIVITGDEDEKLLLKSIENGAVSFLLKPFSMTYLVENIKTTLENGSFLPHEQTKRLMKVLKRNKINDTYNGVIKLSKRQKNILNLIEQGYTYKEMSSILNISYHTVNQHVKNLYRKMKVNNKFELINNSNISKEN